MFRALYEATQVIWGDLLLESSLHLTLHICSPHFSLCNNKYICSFFHDSFSGSSRLLFLILSYTRLHFCSFNHSPCVLLKYFRTYIAKENILGLWDSLCDTKGLWLSNIFLVLILLILQEQSLFCHFGGRRVRGLRILDSKVSPILSSTTSMTSVRSLKLSKPWFPCL